MVSMLQKVSRQMVWDCVRLEIRVDTDVGVIASIAL